MLQGGVRVLNRGKLRGEFISQLPRLGGEQAMGFGFYGRGGVGAVMMMGIAVLGGVVGVAMRGRGDKMLDIMAHTRQQHKKCQ